MTSGEPSAAQVEGSTGIQVGTGNHQTIHYHGAFTAERVPDSVELSALTESVTAPLAVMDVTRQLRGREEIVDALVHRFDDPGQGRVHLLHGLGGSGKTSIAAEVARRVPATVWWVSAVDKASLVSGMHAVARLAGATSEELQPEGAADVLWRRLNALRKPWLLVVDNADDPAVLEEDTWIRPFLGGHGLVLLTSRRGSGWGGWVVPHQVKMLAPDDGAQVLLDHTRGGGGTLVEAQALADRLGGLPLALSLAGSYLAQSIKDPWPDPATVTTFQGFQAALDDGRLEVLAPPADTDQPGERDSRLLIDNIWQLSIQFLERRGLPLAAPFMRLLSQFADAPLPYQLMLDRETLTGSPLFADLDHTQARSLIREMGHLDLIDLTAEGDLPTLRMHPLMRDASRRYNTQRDEDYLKLASRLLVKATEGEEGTSPQDHRRWPFWQLVTPHATHLMRTFPRNPGLETSLVDQIAHTVDLAGFHLYCRGFYKQAQVEYENLHAFCQELLGAEHPQTLTARHGLAILLANGGEYSKAQDECESVLDLRRRVLGEEHQDTLTTRHTIAAILKDRGDLPGAQVEFQAALDLQRQILGEQHLNTLTTRHEFAAVLIAQGDLPGAQAELEAVLDIQQRNFGQEHPHTLTTRHNLAKVLRDRGDVRGAQAEFKATLDLQRQILGEEHPDTITNRHNIAAVEFEIGNRRDAVKDMQAVLEIRERILGAQHPHTLMTRKHLNAMRKALAMHNKPAMWHGPGKRKKKKKKR